MMGKELTWLQARQGQKHTGQKAQWKALGEGFGRNGLKGGLPSCQRVLLLAAVVSVVIRTSV